MTSFTILKNFRFNKYLCKVQQKIKNHELEPFISDPKLVTA
jgi:hypothetical protein